MPFRMLIEVMPIWTVDRKSRGLLVQPQGGHRARVTLLGERLKPRLARGDERDLRHREDAVEDDEREENREVHEALPEA